MAPITPHVIGDITFTSKARQRLELRLTGSSDVVASLGEQSQPQERAESPAAHPMADEPSVAARERLGERGPDR